MFPNLRQRLIIALTVVIGGLFFLAVRYLLTGPGGAEGISLMSARIGPVFAFAVVMAAAVPALGLGVVVSSSGNPLSGIFAAGAALAALAGWGGSIDGWMKMHDDARTALPGAYAGLIFETVLWQLPLVAMLVAIAFWRQPLRRRWPRLVGDHHGADASWATLDVHAVFAGLVCALVSAFLAFFLLRVADTKQVILGLMIAFTFGGLMGHLLFPQSNPLFVLLSPAIVAIGAYAYVLLRFDTSTQVLAAAWALTLSATHRLPGPALALPIHYASAAVAGAAMGVGWAQVMHRSSQGPETVGQRTSS